MGRQSPVPPHAPRSRRPHPAQDAARYRAGEDISALSAHELEARIARLDAEIARCREAIAARHATRSAAEGFFKK
jgi:uncharacterized small protein (DUF1192 family)